MSNIDSLGRNQLKGKVVEWKGWHAKFPVKENLIKYHRQPLQTCKAESTIHDPDETLCD